MMRMTLTKIMLAAAAGGAGGAAWQNQNSSNHAVAEILQKKEVMNKERSTQTYPKSDQEKELQSQQRNLQSDSLKDWQSTGAQAFNIIAFKNGAPIYQAPHGKQVDLETYPCFEQKTSWFGADVENKFNNQDLLNYLCEKKDNIANIAKIITENSNTPFIDVDIEFPQSENEVTAVFDLVKKINKLAPQKKIQVALPPFHGIQVYLEGKTSQGETIIDLQKQMHLGFTQFGYDLSGPGEIDDQAAWSNGTVAYTDNGEKSSAKRKENKDEKRYYDQKTLDMTTALK
jgi:hypothetical protein